REDNSHDAVQTGEIIGYSVNSGFARGFHLHFHMRSEPSGDVNGVRPVPMYGIEVETGKTPITNFVEGFTYRAVDPPSGQPFDLTPELAFQVTFPTLESYQYQIEYSSNLVDWLPANERFTACSNIGTVTFK